MRIEEFYGGVCEFNNSYNESSSVVFTNDYATKTNSSVSQELNTGLAKVAPKKSSTTMLSLLSKLVIAFAAVAVVQPTILAPLFSV